MLLLANQENSLNPLMWLEPLAQCEKLLIIQDLDGVCMGLVRDPLTRTLSTDYLQAAKQLDDCFYVLTNGEHEGRRGVNRIVEASLEPDSMAAQQGLYLPGLAAGGVQWQDRFGRVSVPGVSQEQLAFLAQVPRQLHEYLTPILQQPPFAMTAGEVARVLSITILDNAVSPTLNLNGFNEFFRDDWTLYYELQTRLVAFFDHLSETAVTKQLSDSFFVHYAPNLGTSEKGERIKWATENNIGTTDFQFMLKGAVKEVGVLVILNRYYYQLTGEYPLGEDFNALSAPANHEQLLALAQRSFDPEFMPTIVAVGDTLTSSKSAKGSYFRGGSDRGFMTLVQQIGAVFKKGNGIFWVDSSGGELNRPSVNVELLKTGASNEQVLAGISDNQDPLKINVIFKDGYRQYVDFFCQLANQRSSKN